MSQVKTLIVTGTTTLNGAPTLAAHALRRAELDAATAVPIPLAGVTGFTGSAPAGLASVATANLQLGARFQFTESATGVRRVVRLVASTAGTATPLITRGPDFDAVSNPRVFILESPPADLKSDDVPEGSVNLYCTPQRAGVAPGALGDVRYVGSNARFVSVSGGFKIQVSADGATWQDALGPFVGS